jgi:hypothetical protein
MDAAVFSSGLPREPVWNVEAFMEYGVGPPQGFFENALATILPPPPPTPATPPPPAWPHTYNNNIEVQIDDDDDDAATDGSVLVEAVPVKRQNAVLQAEAEESTLLPPPKKRRFIVDSAEEFKLEVTSISAQLEEYRKSAPPPPSSPAPSTCSDSSTTIASPENTLPTPWRSSPYRPTSPVGPPPPPPSPPLPSSRQHTPEYLYEATSPVHTTPIPSSPPYSPQSPPPTYSPADFNPRITSTPRRLPVRRRLNFSRQVFSCKDTPASPPPSEQGHRIYRKSPYPNRRNSN